MAWSASASCQKIRFCRINPRFCSRSNLINRLNTKIRKTRVKLPSTWMPCSPANNGRRNQSQQCQISAQSNDNRIKSDKKTQSIHSAAGDRLTSITPAASKSRPRSSSSYRCPADFQIGRGRHVSAHRGHSQHPHPSPPDLDPPVRKDFDF